MIQVSSHNTKTVKIRHIDGGTMSWIEIELFGPSNPHISENKLAIFGLNDDYPDLEVNWGDRAVAGSMIEASVNEELLAACKRSVQYLHIAIHDGKRDGLEASTINLVRQDLQMVEAAIAKVEGGE